MASIVITGTSKGIGLATALVLGRAGHTVYATMRNPVGAPQLAQIAQKEGLPIHVSAMDVDSNASVTEAIRAIEKVNGPLDVWSTRRDRAERLYRRTRPRRLPRCDGDKLFRSIALHQGGVTADARASQRLHSQSHFGLRPNFFIPAGAYAASKFALEGLSEALAQEAKMFNIRVAIVQPGIIDTAMTAASPSKPTRRRIPRLGAWQGLFTASLQTPTSPEEVAQKIREIIESGNWQLRHPVDLTPSLS